MNAPRQLKAEMGRTTYGMLSSGAIDEPPAFELTALPE
jgi:hypothetical protein